MRNLIILVLATQYFTVALTQGNFRFVRVEYSFKAFMSQGLRVDSIIELIQIDNNGDTIRSRIKNKLEKTSFDVNLMIVATGDNSRSTIKIMKVDNAGSLPIQLNIPDKLTFNNNKWYSHKGEKVKEIEKIKYSSIATDSFKTIVGFACRKYLVTEVESKNKFEVWVTKKLPRTLLPGGGYMPFNGAVLEMHFPQKNIRFLATKVSYPKRIEEGFIL